MDVVKTALRSLWRKRLRTLLTMSGIVVGVALVAVVTVIGAAGKTAVNTELENMGLGGLSVTASGDAALEKEMLAALRELDEVISAVPLMIDMTVTAERDGGTESLMLCGIDSGETQAIGLSLQHGRLLSAADVAQAARVCVVDASVAQAVLHRDNIIGASLVIPVSGIEESFTVVGVTEAGSTLLQNVTQLIPGMVYIPYTTMQQLSGRTAFDQFAVRLAEETDTGKSAKRIEAVLAKVGGSDSYSAQDLASQKEKLSGVMDIVALVLTAISAVALLVAGLSIMTIMTVSVSERTREIGIKKALGATKGIILREFLAEALLLSLGGGVIGVALGGGAGMLGIAAFGIAVPWPSAAGWLIVFAAGIGVVFGVYPAMKAARLDPVEALKEQ